MAKAATKKAQEPDQNTESNRSFTVLKPFMHKGERVEVEEVLDDLPLGSVGELIHTGKIKPVGGKRQTR